MTEVILYILTGLLLAGCTVTDLRRRAVWWPACALAGAAGVLLHLLVPGLSVWESLAGLMAGAAALAVSAACRGALGAGDGLVIGACGCLLGLAAAVEIFCTALVLAGGYALYLLLHCRAQRSRQFAFIPFMLAGYAAYVAAVWAG